MGFSPSLASLTTIENEIPVRRRNLLLGLRLCLHSTGSKRIQTDPVRKSDRLGVLFTCFGTGPQWIQTDPNGSKTGPSVLQVQFWIRSEPVPERSCVNAWISSKRFHVKRSQSGPVGLERFRSGPV